MKRIFLLGMLPFLAAVAQTPKFEIADVHSSKTAPGFAQNFGGVLREGRYVNRDATMLKLISSAYGVSEDSIAGPGWINSDLFDVVAKVPDGATTAAANLMLKDLLTERFGLVARNGTRPVPRYVLAVAKGGPKLKPPSGADNPGCRQIQQPGAANPSDLASAPDIKVTCHDLTPAAIGDNLHQMAGGYVDHDVVDATKLEGTYDFDLQWTPRGALDAKGSSGTSLFAAVEKQLGLRLELQNRDVPGLVIESVNRKPSTNPPSVTTALAFTEARFEAATIKPADPGGRPLVGLLYTGGSQMKAGGTLRQLIAMTLQVMPTAANDMVVGLPKSADTQQWDITAKVPATGEGAPHVVNGRPLPPPLSVGLEMLRGLLLDQFELKTHTENREVTVYALTIGTGKPKLAKAEESERTECKPDPNAPMPATNVTRMIRCTNTSVDELAPYLQQAASAYIDHPVVDATGLEGGWNFLVGWTPKGMLQPPPASNPVQPAGLIEQAAEPDGISVFEAVERELGLKLVKQRKSIPVIVVDHVDEKPLE